jgi:hypothetical protein
MRFVWPYSLIHGTRRPSLNSAAHRICFSGLPQPEAIGPEHHRNANLLVSCLIAHSATSNPRLAHWKLEVEVWRTLQVTDYKSGPVAQLDRASVS